MPLPHPDSNASFLRRIGLFSIGLICLGYSLFTADFAEMQLSLPGFPVPIFVGEMLLFFCVALLAVLWMKNPPGATRWHILLGCYVAWVLATAFSGHGTYGPLALRSAALFYYPLFAVITFAFFRKEDYSLAVTQFLWLLTGILLFLHVVNGYFQIPCFLFFILLSLGLKKEARILTAVAAVLLLWPYQFFGVGSRSHMVSYLLACLWLFSYLVFAHWPMSSRQRPLVWFFLLGALLLTFIRFADQTALKTLIAVDQIGQLYRHYDKIVEERKARYHPIPINPQIYQSNRHGPATETQVREKLGLVDEAYYESLKGSRGEGAQLENSPGQERFINVDGEDVSVGTFSQSQSQRPWSTAYLTAVFRLFVWRDMIQEMIHERAWWGINWGKPQRSPSLEILEWGVTSWGQDGWILPHNSYLHMIYRAGIVGVIMVLSLFWILGWLAWQSFRNRFLPQALLLSVLVYWFTLGHSMVLLELPYYAIPIWSLLGIMLALAKDQSVTGHSIGHKVTSHKNFPVTL